MPRFAVPKVAWAALLLLACGSQNTSGLPPAGARNTGGISGKGSGGRSGASAQGGAPGTADGTGGTSAQPGPAPADAAASDAAAPNPGDAPAPPPAPSDAAPTAEAGPGPAPATGAFKLDGVATWRGNATAAFSIIHDDVCDPSVNGVFTVADPELTKRGLRAGFGVIVGSCESQKAWEKVKTLIAHGHDLFNHSWSHNCINTAGCSAGQTPTSDFAKELDQSTKVIKDRTGVDVQYFIFPYDNCGPGAVARLKELGYLGDRCGPHGITPHDFADAFKTNYDVWGPSYSIYKGKGPCAGIGEDVVPSRLAKACRDYVMKQYIDETIAMKGWGNREMHGFDPDDNRNGGWQTVPHDDYTVQLDYLKAKQDAGELWVEGPTPIIRYRFAREACAAPTVAGNKLTFAAPTPNCQKYATTLTYVITTSDGSDPATLSAQQGAVTLKGRKLGAGRFAVDADPTKGDATLVP